MTEQFINSDAQPTGPDAVLDADHVIADGVLSIVSCPARILAAGPEFRVKIGHTICKVTNLGAGNIEWEIDVVEDSTDDNYITGTPIYLEATAGAIKDAIFDKPFVFANDQTAQYPNSVVQPAASDADPQDTGTTDPGVSDDYSRADHVHFSAGGGGGSAPSWLTFTPPPTSGWSWDNQGSSTITSSASKQYIHAPSQAALRLVLRYRTAPSAPYNVDFALMHIITGIEGQSPTRVGYVVAFRDSGGKIVAFRFAAYDGSYSISIDKWNSATSINAIYSGTTNTGTVLVQVARAPQWFRLQDDGTNLKFYYSLDGEEWLEFASHPRGDFLTTAPNAVGFGAMPENGTCDISLVHYAES